MAVAIATAITTAIPSLAGYTAAVTAAASVALYAGTAYAQYLITQAQQPKEKVGTKLRFSFGSDVPLSIIIGETETAGSLVYVGSWGRAGRTPNAYLVQVFCLSDMPSTELQPRIWINGEKDQINFGAGHGTENGNSIGFPVVGKRKGSDDRMWIKFLDGGQTVADPYLRDKFGSADRAWTADHIGRGRTLVIVTTKYDKDEPDSIPLCRFVVKGIALYNPKKDSTNGGVGSHRWGNANTYEYENNAGVVEYNVSRGIYYDGEWMYGGKNWPAWALDNNSFFTSITAANDDIPLKGGGTQKRWEIGGEISLDSAVFDTLEEIHSACNGRMAVSGGKLFFDCGPYGASEFVFTDAELFVNESIEATLETSVRDRFNTIIATYTEPDIGGELKAIKPKTVQAYLDADGGAVRRSTPSLRLCRNHRQAQRAALRMLHDNRRTLARQVIMGPERRDGMRANLVAAWDSPRYQYSEKEWIIGDTMKYPTGVMLVELRELNPNDDSWNPVTDEDDIPVGTWTRSVPDAQTMPITAVQWPIKNATGALKAPGIKILWDIDEDDVDVKRIIWEVRLLDGTEVMADGTADYEKGFAVINKGLVKNEAYQVRAKLIPISNWRLTAWTDWADTSVYPGGLTYILAPNASEVSDSAPPAIAATPTQEIITRVHRSNQVRQRVKIDVSLSGRDATESYRVRLFDITDSLTENIKTDEFAILPVVQSGHEYSIRIAPVSRFGVIGPYTTAILTGVVPKKSGAVPDISGFDIASAHGRISLEWDEPDLDAYPDVAEVQIQRANNSDFSSGVKNFKRRSTTFNDTGLGNNVTRYYRARFFDSSGSPGNWSSTKSATTPRLDTDDYKTDSIVTEKILPRSIEDRIGWVHKGQNQNWVSQTKKKKTAWLTLGKSASISNPNPSAVHLQISFSAKAQVNTPYTLGDGGWIKMTTEVVIWSSPAADTSKKKAIYRLKLVGSVSYDNGKAKTKIGRKNVKKLTVMDLYKGSSGSADPRKYWAEVKFYLVDGGSGASNFSGYGEVKGFVVEGEYSKR